jgi:mRNA interferase MazF
MAEFVKGDIVVIPFPFSDLSNTKRRPAIILADLTGDDYIMSQITSKNIYDDMSVLILANDTEGGSLSVDSNIRPNKLFTADKNIVLYKICSLKKEKLDIVINKVVDIFTN